MAYMTEGEAIALFVTELASKISSGPVNQATIDLIISLIQTDLKTVIEGIIKEELKKWVMK